ncbi:MAG: YdeI/OmpD-associated family protein [Dyadobacter sp.]|uniref:YdeI/OmpD-associated family protein n=1 Tax=Dyadobacter sp. TaxID=1914288 RepID=UPI003264433E
MAEKEIKTFHPADRQEWRAWLLEHYDQEKSVWLIYYKKKSNVERLTWSDAVDEALCFGWIDSLAKPLDEERYMQFFSRRKAKSVWSGINKEKVQRLTEEGLMTKAGLESVEIAKLNGSWTTMDEAQAMVVPADLEAEFEKRPNAKSYFLSLSKSDKRNILQWLIQAKRPETRQKRIIEIVENADQNLKPKALQWTKKPTND